MAVVSKSKVFVSYSRHDLEFTDQLVEGLEETSEFYLLIDREGIGHGEDWKARLRSLILECDTMVFVLSPDSIVSDVCAWEIEEALTLSKRIIPVLWRRVDFAQAPKGLSAINAVPFDNERAVTGLAKLVSALQSDLDWLREHTRLSERAAEWENSGRAAELLLRGSALKSVQDWLTARPATAPEATRPQRAYIQASEEEESRILSAERRRAEELESAKGAAEAERDAATAAQRKERAAAHRARIFAVAALLLFLLAGYAAWYAYENEGIARSEAISAQLSSMQAQAEQNFARANFNNILKSRIEKLPPFVDQKRYLDSIERNQVAFSNRGNMLLERVFEVRSLPLELRSPALGIGAFEKETHLDVTLHFLKLKHGNSIVIKIQEERKVYSILYGGGQLDYKTVVRPAIFATLPNTASGRPKIDLMISPDSHASHLTGLNRLMKDEINAQDNGTRFIDLKQLWYNTFAPLPPVSSDGGRMSPIAREAISNARNLDIRMNEPFDYFVAATDDGPARVTLAQGLSVLVMGPTLSDLESLHKDWKRGSESGRPSLVDQIDGFVEGYSSADIQLLRAPAFEKAKTVGHPGEVVNASSLLLLLEIGDHRILLCGDADSNRILRGLKSAGLLEKRYVTVDVFLLPNFGAMRQSSFELFRAVRARHYVISAGQQFGLPDSATVNWIIQARGADSDRYAIHLTHTPDEIISNANDDRSRARAMEFHKAVDSIVESNEGKNFEGFSWPAGKDTMITIRLQ